MLYLLSFLVLLVACSVATRAEQQTEQSTPMHAGKPFMQVAIEEAVEGITQQQGGSFGSVIVKNGEIVGQGHNQVL